MKNYCWVVRDYNGHIKLFSSYKDASEEFKSDKHIWQAVFQEEIHMSDYEVHLDMPIGAPTITDDPVTHPAHYTFGKVEAIDAIESAVTGLDPFEAFCIGTAIKYLFRYKKKTDDPEKWKEDLRKSKFYIDKLLEE